MAHIQLDIPDTRVVVRQPSAIVDRSKIPIQSVAEFALTASYAVNSITLSASFATVALTVLQNTFTGSFFGTGSDLVFSTIGTNQPSNSVLVIGNRYNNYEYIQETIFQNSNVTVSGSVNIAPEGLLILYPRSSPEQFITGGLFFSSSGDFYVGL